MEAKSKNVENRVRSAASPRAAASIVFACLALFLWWIYGTVHLILQNRMAGSSRHQLLFVHTELTLAYFALAGLATLWCFWSWMTESRTSAVVATLFTLIAVAVVTTMGTYVR
jgi:hypothetical protein